MEYCVSLSVSYEVVCVVIIDDKGRAIDDFLVPTAPDIIDCVLRELDMHITQIGIEFGVVGQWLAQELQDRGWNAFCLEYANVGSQSKKSSFKGDGKRLQLSFFYAEKSGERIFNQKKS
jgi:hypothetical protein